MFGYYPNIDTKYIMRDRALFFEEGAIMSKKTVGSLEILRILARDGFHQMTTWRPRPLGRGGNVDPFWFD